MFMSYLCASMPPTIRPSLRLIELKGGHEIFNAEYVQQFSKCAAHTKARQALMSLHKSFFPFLGGLSSFHDNVDIPISRD